MTYGTKGHPARLPPRWLKGTIKNIIILYPITKCCTKKNKMFVHTYNMLCFCILGIDYLVFMLYRLHHEPQTSVPGTSF